MSLLILSPSKYWEGEGHVARASPHQATSLIAASIRSFGLRLDEKIL